MKENNEPYILRMEHSDPTSEQLQDWFNVADRYHKERSQAGEEIRILHDIRRFQSILSNFGDIYAEANRLFDDYPNMEGKSAILTSQSTLFMLLSILLRTLQIRSKLKIRLFIDDEEGALNWLSSEKK